MAALVVVPWPGPPPGPPPGPFPTLVRRQPPPLSAVPGRQLIQSSGVNLDENKLAEVLVSQFELAKELLELARMWHRERGGSLADILIEMRAVTESDMRKAIGIVGLGVKSAEDRGGRERRSERRLGHLGKLGFTIHVPSSCGDSRPLDLCCGGLGLLVERPARMGEIIAVEIGSPTGTRVRCELEVRHVRRVKDGNAYRYLLGCRFADLSAAERFAVEAMVAEAGRLLAQLKYR